MELVKEEMNWYIKPYKDTNVSMVIRSSSNTSRYYFGSFISPPRIFNIANSLELCNLYISLRLNEDWSIVRAENEYA